MFYNQLNTNEHVCLLEILNINHDVWYNMNNKEAL